MGPRGAAAWVWLLAFAAAAVLLALRLPGAGLETGVFELVPWRAPDASADAGAAAVRRRVEGRLLVLCGAADAEAAETGAEAYAAALRSAPGVGSVVCAVPADALRRGADFFAPACGALMTDADRAALARGGDALVASALRGLAQPAGFAAGVGFVRDPLGLFGRWLAQAGGAAGSLAVSGGHLELRAGGRTWVAVSADTRGGLDADGVRALDAGLERAAAAARARGAAEVLRSGFVFHEHAAAAQARREVGWVGSASTALLALLLWLVFRRPLPMALALLPAAVGCVAGAAAVLALWPRVHAVAMVFGATVVGVADDYGLYFLSGAYDGRWDPRARARAALAPVGLALATSVLGYAALGLLPIPALKQVAVFACVGLAADWAGVMLWFPWATRNLAAAPSARISAAAGLRSAWPRWGSPALAWAVAAVLAVAAVGCLRLRTDDDVRLLYAHDAELDREQAQVQALTGVGGATGFFVVRAADPQRALEREEALRDALALAGAPRWQAVSAWVPSLRRQRQDSAALRTALAGGAGLAKRLERALGQPGLARTLVRACGPGPRTLLPQAWLADPVSAPWRGLWLPQPDGSVVSLVLPGPGLSGADLERLAPVAAAVAGVEYVDQLRAVGGLLAELRRLLTWMLAAGGALVFLALVGRLGRQALAAAAPTAVGVVAGLGALGWSGQPVNLFAVLALLLLLSTAVDFGIYTQDGEGRLSSFVAVQVAALTNIAAVGVLAFSATPALRSFGLVIGVGCVAAWLSSPCFAPRERA